MWAIRRDDLQSINIQYRQRQPQEVQKMRTDLVLVDDNLLFRKGLGALLSQQADLHIAGDLPGVRDVVQTVMRLEPHILILDAKLTGSSGLEIAAQIRHRKPQIKTLILTDSRSEEHVHAALRIGVDAYLLKDATPEELLFAIRSVAQGKKYISPDVSGHLVSGFLHPEQSRGQAAPNLLSMLTTRERSVLQLIAEGRSNRSAAEFLSVSPKTIEKHRANLMRKLDLKNATDMVLTAMELGLVERPTFRSHKLTAASFLEPTNTTH
jgi:DNA-binding NarL/FixJ family response regulator